MRHGILLIDKPTGLTSHDVVHKARKILHEPKIGHIGTLDPAASGLLVLFVGKKALKVIELFNDLNKEYETRAQFGAVSTTYDGEGLIEDVPEKKGWSPPTQTELIKILNAQFVGNIKQIPPLHSAVHVSGKRAYELARKDPNTDLILPEREVHISAIQLVSYGYPEACIRIACGTGTYIRSIVHDLGQIMRCGAYVKGLRRLSVGEWRVEDSCKLEDIAWTDVVPLKEILTDFPRHDLSDDEWKEIQHGRTIDMRIMEEPMIAWHEKLPVAILEQKEGRVKARKVL